MYVTVFRITLESRSLEGTMNVSGNYEFPAVKGIQAGRECYTAMVPLKSIPQMFRYPPPSKNLKARDRAQRTITQSRVRTIDWYIRGNLDSYILPSITVVINSDIEFDPLGHSARQNALGLLKFPASAKVNVVDGQHRCAAISDAVGFADELSEESIAVMFFVNRDLKALQQMFADLNRHAAKPTRSIGILFDQRDLFSRIAVAVADRAIAFNGFVDEEKNTLTRTSGKLFALSAIYDATTKYLLKSMPIRGEDDEEFAVQLSVEFWNTIDSIIPQWRSVRENLLSAGEVRDDYIHTQSVSMCAIGSVGNYLLRHHPKEWKNNIVKIKGVNWSRTNYELWNGRCLEHNQIKKANANIVLVSNVLKKRIGIKLNSSEKALEDDWERSKQK